MKITLIRSGISRNKEVQRTLRSLKLYKVNQTVEVKDSPELKGMVEKVKHLLEIH